jgi:hypothetical protein
MDKARLQKGDPAWTLAPVNAQLPDGHWVPARHRVVEVTENGYVLQQCESDGRVYMDPWTQALPRLSYYPRHVVLSEEEVKEWERGQEASKISEGDLVLILREGGRSVRGIVIRTTRQKFEALVDGEPGRKYLRRLGVRISAAGGEEKKS